jgi:hypothetical protein
MCGTRARCAQTVALRVFVCKALTKAKQTQAQPIAHQPAESHRVQHDVGRPARRIPRGPRASHALAELEALEGDPREVPARAVGMVGRAEPAPKVRRQLVVILKDEPDLPRALAAREASMASGRERAAGGMVARLCKFGGVRGVRGEGMQTAEF